MTAAHGEQGFITVHSMGGLGNQLFIYAAGAAAANAAGLRLRVDSQHHSSDPSRPFLLERLGFQALYVNAEHQGGAIGRRFRRRCSAPPEGCTYREPSFRYDSRVVHQRDGACLYGYFQSWRYVEHASPSMRSTFDTLRARMRRNVDREFYSALTAPSAIGLHVRRGDYLAALDTHGIVHASYYENAVRILRRMGFTGSVYLFSDDVDAAMKELGHLPGIQPAETSGLQATDEMLLMSECSALVTANSSFSWWAGMLGQSLARPVITPRPWFAASVDTRDLLPPHWLTLGGDDRRECKPNTGAASSPIVQPPDAPVRLKRGEP